MEMLLGVFKSDLYFFLANIKDLSTFKTLILCALMKASSNSVNTLLNCQLFS